MTRFKALFAVLAVVLIAFVGSVPGAGANPGVHVAVPKSPLPVGQPVYITYYTDLGEDGTANVFIRQTQTGPDVWNSGSWALISGGIAYDITAPALSTAGTYYAGVQVAPNNCPGCQDELGLVPFDVVASATDWAVLSVSLSPSAPQVGDPVTFSMVVSALSSPGGFPQSFAALCVLDGASCGGGSFNYPGPTGTPFTVSAQKPWTATLGTHTLKWGVATIPVGLDPDKSNNAMTKNFTVGPHAPFDFSIFGSPAQQSVAPGGSTSYGVAVNLVSGQGQSVALSISTLLPAGVSASLTPASGTPPFTSALNVTTTASASPGPIELTISGAGGGASHSAAVTLTVSRAIVVSCPFASDQSFGDKIGRGFYVSSYPGSNLNTVRVQYGADTAGTYTISMTAAVGAFDGPTIGSTQTVTVDLTQNSWKDAVYNFGGAPVPAGSTIAFTQAKVNGPSGALVFYNTGNGNMSNTPGPTCSLVTETQDTTPPLSTPRRPTVGLEITQLMSITTSSATQVQSSSSSTETSAPPGATDLVTILQENYLIAIAALILILVLVALGLRRRRKPAAGAAAQAAPMTYCPKCGAQNPAAHQFCGKCGVKLW